MRAVASTFNVSVGFVHHVVNLRRMYGQVTDPYAQPRLNLKHQILTFMDETRDELFAEHGVHASLATISRTLARMQCSKKSLSRRATERNKQLQSLWELEVTELDDPNLFVFVDESAIDNRTVQRSSGWSGVGGRSISRCAFFRGKRHSILLALSSDGIIALDIFEGSVNKERFLQFLCEQVVCPFYVT